MFRALTEGNMVKNYGFDEQMLFKQQNVWKNQLSVNCTLVGSENLQMYCHGSSTLYSPDILSNSTCLVYESCL